MRVLLSPSFQLELDRKQTKALEPYPPLGTLYAASFLRERGHEVLLSDSMLASGHAEYEADLDRFRPQLVALYEDNFNYLSKMCLTNMRAAAFEKARLGRSKGARVVVNGSDATDRLEEYLRADIDVALLGEGEQSLAELVEAFALGGSTAELGSVAGLAYVGGDGEIVKTAPRGLIQDLDGLPFPAWDLIDAERYRSAWRKRHDIFSINMVTTRGCPYHCNWCAKPIYGQRYGVRSPANVAEELAWVKHNLEPDHIWFADDIFGLEPGWVEAFAREVESRGVVTSFKIQARVDLIDETVATALARAGCESVWLGAESGSQKILDAMDKGTRVEQIHDAARLLRSHGIRVCFFLQFGYPGEEWEDIEKTLSMVRLARPDDIGISVSYPLPGTPFYERVRSQLGDKRNWTDSDDLDLMFRGRYTPGFYRALHRFVHRDFRLRRELGRLPRPVAVARVLRELGGLVVARTRLEVLSHRRNRALGVA